VNTEEKDVVNGFDDAILTFLTQHAFHAAFINRAIRAMTEFYTIKGLVLITAIWWIWLAPSEHRKSNREIVIATIVSGLLALLIGRLMAHYLPFRIRPIDDPSVHLHFPEATYTESTLRFWSSFPSDHAMMWGAIATGVFLVYRFVGVLALLYTVLFILLPRVYLGLHYPTDVITGLLLGFALTCLMTRMPVRERIAAPILRLIERFPAPGYTFAFILCFEMITQFDDLRVATEAIRKAL
jgi:undecaprenyl-diphosphatase